MRVNNGNRGVLNGVNGGVKGQKRIAPSYSIYRGVSRLDTSLNLLGESPTCF